MSLNLHLLLLSSTGTVTSCVLACLRFNEMVTYKMATYEKCKSYGLVLLSVMLFGLQYEATFGSGIVAHVLFGKPSETEGGCRGKKISYLECLEYSELTEMAKAEIPS